MSVLWAGAVVAITRGLKVVEVKERFQHVKQVGVEVIGDGK
jgi:hypothetical protein